MHPLCIIKLCEELIADVSLTIVMARRRRHSTTNTAYRLAKYPLLEWRYLTACGRSHSTSNTLYRLTKYPLLRLATTCPPFQVYRWSMSSSTGIRHHLNDCCMDLLKHVNIFKAICIVTEIKFSSSSSSASFPTFM